MPVLFTRNYGATSINFFFIFSILNLIFMGLDQFDHADFKSENRFWNFFFHFSSYTVRVFECHITWYHVTSRDGPWLSITDRHVPSRAVTNRHGSSSDITRYHVISRKLKNIKNFYLIFFFLYFFKLLCSKIP
jgi:hypothetical protein